MTDTEALRGIIAKSGLKMKYIAERMGIVPLTLTNKIENRTEFTAGEVNKLCGILGITSFKDVAAIFFGSGVE